MQRPALFIVNPAEKATMKRLPGNTTYSRVTSIDLLRGIVMIIMALDHVRDYFHYSAFFYSPTDLTQTTVPLFFTRFITHYCAPVFVFLAGVSAFLYGTKRSKKEMSHFLLTRGIWLVLVEIFIVSLFRTFNPLYTYTNLQVIWAIGISMMVLAGLVWLPRQALLVVSIAIVFGHNLLDNIHFPGSFFWSLLHDASKFTYGDLLIYTRYPVLPWIGIMALGYCMGSLYDTSFDPSRRRKLLLAFGIGAIALFVALRSNNWYGDFAHWSVQKNAVFSFLSFINVTKYPPSLLYTLITLGPALIFLAFAEKPLNALSKRIIVFGRTAMFYYLAHILLIHILAVLAGILSNSDKWWEITILHDSVNSTPQLKGFGFGLITNYLVWIGLVLFLYPLCKRFDTYKRANLATKPWLSYF